LIETREHTKKITTEPFDRKELPLTLLFLAGVLLLKAGLTLLLYRNGYLEYDGDGFTRSVHAWEWLQKPRIEVDAWLPLQFWLNGFLMNFWSDLYWQPRAVNLLASCITTLNLFFLGRWLFGKGYGYACAALVALFPWEIKFGLSGMAESLTHMFLSIGVMWFARWLQTRHLSHLSFAALGLLGATMLRYEAWFYSLTFCGIVLFLSLRTGKFHWKTLAVLAIPFSFAFIWCLASWVQLGKPWGFVSLTSEINATLAAEANQNADFLERLVFYPRTMYNLMPWLTILAIIGTVLLVFFVRQARSYLALVWGEFCLFIIITLPTNNIAPGSARYPVSNLLLLLPVVVWLVSRTVEISIKWVLKTASVRKLQLITLLVGGAIFALILGLFAASTLDHAYVFPDKNVRQVALWFNEQTESGNLPSNVVIPVHFPNPKAENGGDYSYIYALTVLTNRPDGGHFPNSEAQGLRVISEINGLLRTVVDDKPLVWLHIETAGDKQTIDDLKGNYHDVVNYGPFTIVNRPMNRPLSVTPREGTLDQTYIFTGDGYDPNEKVSVWLTWGNQAQSLPTVIADSRGHLTITFKPFMPITQSVTAKGLQSGRQGFAEIKVKT